MPNIRTLSHLCDSTSSGFCLKWPRTPLVDTKFALQKALSVYLLQRGLGQHRAYLTLLRRPRRIGILCRETLRRMTKSVLTDDV